MLPRYYTHSQNAGSNLNFRDPVPDLAKLLLLASSSSSVSVDPDTGMVVVAGAGKGKDMAADMAVDTRDTDIETMARAMVDQS